MIYDLVVYSAILFGPNLIARGLGMNGAVFNIWLEVAFVIPASVGMSWWMIDRLGRKPLQVWGFAASAVVLVIFALLKVKLAGAPMLAFIAYGLFNVTQTGPGLVSGAGVYGVELAPTRIRTVAQSITVAGGRIGAAISGFAFPMLFGRIGEVGAVLILAGLSLLGAVCTQFMVPETRARSLEDINREHVALGPVGG